MELVNVYSTGRTVDFQRYDDKDNQLIVSSYTNTQMDPNTDTVEVTVYGESGEFLDYNPIITTFKVSQGNVDPVTGFYTKIELDPKTDVNALGLTRGRVSAQYNLLKPLFNSSNSSKYWIKEISPSGTELKLSSQNLSNEVIRAGFANFQAYVSTKNYYVDFYLNFGQNRLVIANNTLLSEEDGEVYLLIKLYEPLPEDFQVKDTLWICDRVADSVIYTIDTQITEDPTAVQNALRGPNNRIKVRERIGQTTSYYSYSSLFSSTVSSSMQQLLSYYQDKSIEINVDYSDFSNFIHFSSATERISNFVYKLGLIEQYKAEIEDTTTFTSLSTSSLAIVSQSNLLAQQSIDNIINKFDTYEYYLYFSSESFAWPKSNSTKPYQLYSVTSSQALNWLGSESTVPTAATASILYSASLYDNRNADRLSNAIPQYLLEDPNNEPYVTFMDMVGQHFDNVWLYYKDLSNRYSSFNSPNLGLSKDIVADALRGFGFNLYTNTSVSDNLYYTLFGMNQDGSLLPPTGSEKITQYVTSSIDTLSPKQLDAEVYKRLYHNLTYLLKTKGTQRGVKALIASYGIPEDILDVNEFGGNSRYTGSGIYEINDQKINYFTQSAELSSSVLSPYVTLQRYNTDYRLNTNDIEVGFSPADQINRNFVSSSGFVNLDQLIGNPSHQYLSYYPDLKTAREDYFASYNYPHSIWEYIRIIKYYNNSLFKTIKDWVPSKANASTGIIVKSHILERNKHARTEPSMSFDNNISESIDMISIAGSDPGAVQGSTQYTEIVNTPVGYVTMDYTEDKAKFTGRLSGSSIQATNGEAFEQDDYPDRLLFKRLRSGIAYLWYTNGSMQFFSSQAAAEANATSAFAYTKTEAIEVGSSIYGDSEFSQVYAPVFPFLLATYLGVNDGFGNEYVVNINTSGVIVSVTKTKSASTVSIPFNNVNYGATYQNIVTINRSKRFFELDYAFNQNVPVNFGLVTMSISNSIDNNFNTYNNPYAPYADIQDYNYATRAFTDSRYYGSKTTSLVYNTYTAPTSGGYEGDSSYGLTAAIDRNSVKIGWVKNFQSSSLNFYDKTSITLKYLVDENQNLVELNQRNDNLFEVQNIFKSGERVIVSLSDLVKPSFQKTLDGTKTIFRGGFSYDPILFRENNERLSFLFEGLTSSTSQFAGYKGVDKNRSLIYSFGGIYNFHESNGWNGSNNFFQEPVTENGLLRSSLNGSNTTLLGNTIANKISSGVWNSSFSPYSQIQANWGISNILSRKTDIFTADPTFVSNKGCYSDILPSLYWSLIPNDLKNNGYVGLCELAKFFGLDNPSVYEIKSEELYKIKFLNTKKEDGGYYTDPDNIRPDNILFKATRPSDYDISLRYPIRLEIGYYQSTPTVYAGVNAIPFSPGMPYQKWGVSFKVFFILEKRTDPNSNEWEYVANTNIDSVTDVSRNIEFDSEYSVIHFKSGQGQDITTNPTDNTNAIIKATLNLQLEKKAVYLTANTELRLRLILMDLDNFATYGRDFYMIFGKNYLNLTDNKINYDPYFEIKDIKTTIAEFEQTVAFEDFNIFTATNNILSFTESFNRFFTSPSRFIPSNPTEKLYSPVIDYMSIQPFDIIRFGPFKNQIPEYYTVITSSISYEQGLQGGNTLELFGDVSSTTFIPSNVGAIFDVGRSWNIGNTVVNKNTIIIASKYNSSAFEFFTRISETTGTNARKFIIKNVKVGGPNPDILDNLLEDKTFTITGTGPEHVKKSIYSTFWSGITRKVSVVEISVEESIPDTESQQLSLYTNYPTNWTEADTWFGGVDCSFQSLIPIVNTKMNVVLDRNISSNLNNLSQNFAILRPKPDETSVIIDHRKFDGNVSQTILVPEDASATIKNKAGDIFKALNTDLTNTNDIQTINQ